MDISRQVKRRPIWRRILSLETMKMLSFNLLLSLILAEAIGVAIYFAETGRYYHLSPPGAELEQPPPRDWVNEAVEAYRLHPFLGFILRPDLRVMRGGKPVPSPSGEPPHNHHGFETAYTYPYERERPEEYLVAFFGGSVASKLASWELENRVFSDYLAAALGRQVEDIVILNFAQGGFKQPQQILTYTYFQSLGQQYDMVINIDGFNEVALSGINVESGVAHDMPSVSHIGPLQDVTSGKAEHLRRVRKKWKIYRNFYRRAWTGEGLTNRLAAGFLVDWTVYRWARRSFLQDRLAYGEKWRPAEDAWLYLQKSPPHLAEATLGQLLSRTVQLWVRSSRQMNQAQKAYGGLYLHFLQANQYYDTGRKMSEEEKQIALSPHSPYARFVKRGYPLLEARLRPLEESGVAVASLIPLYDQVEEPVYNDDCCHYNDLGQHLMAEVIGRIAAEKVASQPAWKKEAPAGPERSSRR